MNIQLSIPCEIVNKSGYDIAKAEYDKFIKLREFHPVHLVCNLKDKSYTCFRLTSRTLLESFNNFKIII